MEERAGNENGKRYGKGASSAFDRGAGGLVLPLLIFVAYAVLLPLLSGAISGAVTETGPNRDLLSVAISIIGCLAVAFVSFFILKREKGGTVFLKGILGTRDLLDERRIYMFGALMAVSGALLAGSVAGIVGPQVRTASVPVPVMVLFAVIAVPVCEELLYRGLIYESVRERAGVFAAIAVSSALFAVSHGSAPQAVSALIMGVVLAYLYEVTCDMRLTIAIHAVYNGIMAFSPEFLTRSAHGMPMTIALPVLEFAAAVYFAYRIHAISGERS